jgi:hypothetical protein
MWQGDGQSMCLRLKVCRPKLVEGHGALLAESRAS